MKGPWNFLSRGAPNQIKRSPQPLDFYLCTVFCLMSLPTPPPALPHLWTHPSFTLPQLSPSSPKYPFLRHFILYQVPLILNLSTLFTYLFRPFLFYYFYVSLQRPVYITVISHDIRRHLAIGRHNCRLGGVLDSTRDCRIEVSMHYLLISNPYRYSVTCIFDIRYPFPELQ